MPPRPLLFLCYSVRACCVCGRKVLASFRGGSCRILVATSVASRGLDVEGCRLVVQLHPAQDMATHTHRSGRTARNGAKGRSVVLVGTPSPLGGGRSESTLADQKEEQKAERKALPRRCSAPAAPPAKR